MAKRGEKEKAGVSRTKETEIQKVATQIAGMDEILNGGLSTSTSASRSRLRPVGYGCSSIAAQALAAMNTPSASRVRALTLSPSPPPGWTIKLLAQRYPVAIPESMPF